MQNLKTIVFSAAFFLMFVLFYIIFSMNYLSGKDTKIVLSTNTLTSLLQQGSIF